MKVSKLIELLQQFDGDTEVYHNNYNHEYGDDSIEEAFLVSAFSQGVVISQCEYADPLEVFENEEDFSSAEEGFIPKLFEEAILKALNNKLLLGSDMIISNSKDGKSDVVKINSIVTKSLSDYTRGE